MHQHILPIRIYYEDTDAGGIVYHANYLKFFERARTEVLRVLGFELSELLKKWDVQFVIRSVKLEFLHSACLDQLLCVITKVSEVKRATVMYNQTIRLESIDGPLLCEANIKVACLNANNRPRGIPNFLSMEMKK